MSAAGASGEAQASSVSSTAGTTRCKTGNRIRKRSSSFSQEHSPASAASWGRRLEKSSPMYHFMPVRATSPCPSFMPSVSRTPRTISRSRHSAKPAYLGRGDAVPWRARRRHGAARRRFPGIHLVRRGDPFTTLARAIVGQQISVKAAQTIWDRLVAATDGAGKPIRLDPARVGRTRMPTLRRVGLSQGKARVHPRPRAPFRVRRPRPARMAGARRRRPDRAADRREGHRPLDRGDVPHVPRTASGRAAGRRHRLAKGGRHALSRRRPASAWRNCASSRRCGRHGAASPRGTCGARSIRSPSSIDE